MASSFTLLRDHGRIVGLGFLAAYLSSFGQTYLIAAFAPEIQATFGLSHGGFGSIYSGATLVSGCVMIWAGAHLDRVPAARYADVAFAGLALGAVLMALAADVATLALALFLLRLSGQGMLGHVAVTSAARLAGGIRGRAVGIATLGFPAAEATMPGIVLTGIALAGSAGWTAVWWAAAALLLAVVAVRIALRRGRATEPMPATTRSTPLAGLGLLRDRRFLALGPTIIGPAAVGTGFFFHQRLLAETQGWSEAVLAGGIAVWAGASVAAIFLTGGLVDRFGAVPLSRFHLLPMALGATMVPLVDHPASAALFFGFSGLTMGATNVILPSMLAEIWGTARLGTVRAMAMALTVLSSALTPGLFGGLADSGIPIETVAWGCAAALAAGAAANAALAASLGRR